MPDDGGSELSNHLIVCASAQILISGMVNILTQESHRTVSEKELCSTRVPGSETVRNVPVVLGLASRKVNPARRWFVTGGHIIDSDSRRGMSIPMAVVEPESSGMV